MSKLKFNSVINNEKYNTVSIYIENGSLNLKEGYQILNVQRTKWGYRKATIKLNDQDLIEKLKSWETQINNHLKTGGKEPITIVYGNRIYPKTETLTTAKKKENLLTFKSIWVNDKNKPFIQHWLE